MQATNHKIQYQNSRVMLRGLISICSAIIIAAPVFAQSAAPNEVTQTQPAPGFSEIVHDCGSGVLGAQDPGGKTVEPGPDGMLPIPPALRVTSENHADLGISNVVAGKNPSSYHLGFCIVNRGGQPAHAPITVQVRAGTRVLLQKTHFAIIAARGGNQCFGSFATDGIKYTGPSLEGATISVTPAANEYSTRDNVCRINW